MEFIFASIESLVLMFEKDKRETFMKVYRTLMGVVAVAGLLALASPASAQRPVVS